MQHSFIHLCSSHSALRHPVCSRRNEPQLGVESTRQGKGGSPLGSCFTASLGGGEGVQQAGSGGP